MLVVLESDDNDNDDDVAVPVVVVVIGRKELVAGLEGLSDNGAVSSMNGMREGDDLEDRNEFLFGLDPLLWLLLLLLLLLLL